MAHEAFHIHWGDVASWVVGIATTIALFVTYGLLRITRREQRAQQAESRQAQARLVSAWCHDVSRTPGNGADAVTVVLQNYSDEPIYGVRVAVGARWSGDPIDYAEPEADLSYVVPPKYRGDLEVTLRLERAEHYGHKRFPPVELLFGDASGRTFWHRDRNGILTQIADDPPPLAEDYFFKTRPSHVSLGSKLLLQVRHFIRNS